MPDSEDREFIREKIINKAAGRRHRIWKAVKLLATAVVFGLVASLFFVLGKKYLEPRLLPEDTQPSESITISRDDEEGDSDASADASLEGSVETGEGVPGESGGEDGNIGESGMDEPSGGVDPSDETSSEDLEALLEQKISEAVNEAVSEQLKAQDEYLSLAWYRRVSSVIRNINKGLVTINSVTQDTDWFNNTLSSENQSSGAVIYTTDAEVLILADYASVRDAEALTVNFASGKAVEARIKKADTITGIAIVSVSKGAIPEDVLKNITTLELGNSYQIVSGTPVLAAGSPAGYTGSVMDGMISLVQKNTVGTDTAFQLLYSNLRIADNGGGFLFNTNGQLVGVLTQSYGDRNTGLPVAIGISSLKGIVEKLSSGIDAAYLGIQGENATADIAAAYDMPQGIYVTRVIMDSPAYLAGLKAGDVITASGTSDLQTTQKLQTFLENYSTGDVIRLKVYRSGQDEYVEMEFEVTLGAR